VTSLTILLMILVVLTCGVAYGQTLDRPLTFEAASVKPAFLHNGVTVSGDNTMTVPKGSAVGTPRKYRRLGNSGPDGFTIHSSA